jgi:hypothetical protein
MDYTVFIPETLNALGFETHLIPNAFQPPHDREWGLSLPDIEFNDRTILVLNFQDRMSWDNRYLELDRVAEKYGSNSNRVLVTTLHHRPEYVYSGPVQVVEFSSHNIREILRLQQHDTSWVNEPKTVGWQCLNGRTVEYRFRAATVLKSWTNGWLSYGNEIPLATWNYGTYRGTENDENFIRLRGVYGTAAVNIVTETQYYYPCLISEKSLLAFAAKQIPIIIGYKGIIRDCENAGFDMFRDIVDTSYEDLPDGIRVEQAIWRNQDLIMGKVDLSHLADRLEANRQHIINGGLIEYYRQQFLTKAHQLAHELILV